RTSAPGTTCPRGIARKDLVTVVDAGARRAVGAPPGTGVPYGRMVRSAEPTVTLAGGRAVGWREWISLPSLGVKAVKAKVDTGARSSCLHAYDLREVRRHGQVWLVFKVHPLQRNDRHIVECEAQLLEYRQVTSSNGRREVRPVIRTDIELGDLRWQI